MLRLREKVTSESMAIASAPNGIWIVVDRGEYLGVDVGDAISIFDESVHCLSRYVKFADKRHIRRDILVRPLRKGDVLEFVED